MISEQFKSCPFCGSDDVDDTCATMDNHGMFYFVFCNTCEAQGPSEYDRDKAIEKWNTRLTFNDYLSNQEEVQPAL